MSNLATHVIECKEKHAMRYAVKEKRKEDEESEEPLNFNGSIHLMDDYLNEGKTNPSIEPTYLGFRRIFSAWLIDEGLPWTTGEAPALKKLFKYLKIDFNLPSDTTVRKELDSIFNELEAKVV